MIRSFKQKGGRSYPLSKHDAISRDNDNKMTIDRIKIRTYSYFTSSNVLFIIRFSSKIVFDKRHEGNRKRTEEITSETTNRNT